MWLSRGRRRSCMRSPTIWCGAVGYCRRWAEDNLLGRLGPSSVPILSRSAILPPIHARSMGGRGTVGAGAARVACPTPPVGVYLSARFPALWGPRGGMLWPPVDLPLPRAAAPTVRTNATSSTCSTHCLWYARHHPAGSPLRVLYGYSMYSSRARPAACCARLARCLRRCAAPSHQRNHHVGRLCRQQRPGFSVADRCASARRRDARAARQARGRMSGSTLVPLSKCVRMPSGNRVPPQTIMKDALETYGNARHAKLPRVNYAKCAPPAG